MKKSKFFNTLLTLGILLGTLTIAVAAEQNIKVLLNGKELSFDVPAQIIGGRTMVPMRGIFEALGANVEWEESTKTITAVRDGVVVIMQINNAVMKVDGKDIALDVLPQIVNGRTLVPARAVAEGLNADVDWNSKTWTVTITNDSKNSSNNNTQNITYYELTPTLEIIIDKWELFGMFVDDELNSFCGRIRNLDDNARVPRDSGIALTFYDNDKNEMFKYESFPPMELEKDERMSFSWGSSKHNANDIKYVSVEIK